MMNSDAAIQQWSYTFTSHTFKATFNNQNVINPKMHINGNIKDAYKIIFKVAPFFIKLFKTY